MGLNGIQETGNTDGLRLVADATTTTTTTTSNTAMVIRMMVSNYIATD